MRTRIKKTALQTCSPLELLNLFKSSYTTFANVRVGFITLVRLHQVLHRIYAVGTLNDSQAFAIVHLQHLPLVTKI